MSEGTWGVVAAVLVGAVFLVAAVSKLADPRGWRAQAAGLRVPSSIAAAVPFVEVAVGALLVVQLGRHVVAWVAFAVLVAMAALLARRIAQGEHPPCACFGAWSATPIGWRHVARNLVLAGAAVAAAVL